MKHSTWTIHAALCRYKYRLVVDESLALGVLGSTGRGACEHFGLTRDDVEITSASLGACARQMHTAPHGGIGCTWQHVSPGDWLHFTTPWLEQGPILLRPIEGLTVTTQSVHCVTRSHAVHLDVCSVLG